ncbi:MAG: preprotein translocase subunit SecY [Candidatus Kerfeldbacteria bacterium]|nr:preprotein translocase subunit SecY [Candidatus Kerfeldbacteria bacterium]
MLEKLGQIWRVRELRSKVLFVLGMLTVFRVIAHIPIPGVDVEALQKFFSSNQAFGLFNVFSGGGLENFSIVMLGVGPYITASIIFQLLTMIIPALERLSKEGQQGYERINQWTRMLSVPLAALQAFGTITLLRQQGGGIIPSMSSFDFATAIFVITGGTMFLMWIGELISEKKIGNGISLLIFAGIVARIPTSIQQTAAVFDPTRIFNYLLLAAVGLLTIAAIVFITEAQRNIPVSYARRIRGNRVFGGVDTHLPLRVNQAGVIPIIFAVSLVVFPPLVAQFFANAKIAWLAQIARGTTTLFQNQFFYAAVYFFLVVAFTYFYTSVVFHPQQIAENLQKQGGFVPGIRPGQHTAEYLSYVSNRIMLAGALFLGIVAVLPNILQQTTNVSTLVVGGTSLLIVVAVVIETVKQIDAQLVMRDYEGF